VQIILVSRHLSAARTITIMPRHVLLAGTGFLALVLSAALLLSWLSVHWRLPIVEDLVLSLQQKESRRIQNYLSNNLQLMATRLGELQGKLMQLDSLGQSISSLAGGKPAAAPAVAPQPAPAPAPAGQGGPFLPTSLSTDELQREIERLTAAVDSRAEEFEALKLALLEKRVRDRLLPTTMPVKSTQLGSPYGARVDPIAGVRARHEGIDFVAAVGEPVVAAADGVVLAAQYHPEFGNMIDIDHGDGLTTRYAHLSRLDAGVGRIVKHGEKIGAVGTTGRSTGPHLHFEVRMFGVPQDPALFLKQGDEFAQLARH